VEIDKAYDKIFKDLERQKKVTKAVAVGGGVLALAVVIETYLISQQ